MAAYIVEQVELVTSFIIVAALVIHPNLIVLGTTLHLALPNGLVFAEIIEQFDE